MFLSSTTMTIVSPSVVRQDRGGRERASRRRWSRRRSTTWTDWPARSRSPGLSACTQTCTVVLFGSVAGLTTVTLPVTGSLPSDGRDRRLVADLDVLRLVLRHVDARDDLRHVHHRQQRRAGGRHLARIERPVGDDAVDGAADLGVGRLRLRAVESSAGRLDLRLRACASAPACRRSAAPAGAAARVSNCRLRLRVRDLRLVDLLPRQRALLEQLLRGCRAASSRRPASRAPRRRRSAPSSPVRARRRRSSRGSSTPPARTGRGFPARPPTRSRFSSSASSWPCLT